MPKKSKMEPTPHPHSKPLGTLASDIAARIVNKRPGFPTWFERLPAEMQTALDEVRERWQEGQIAGQQRAFAIALAAEVASRGFPEPGVQAVVAWIRKRR